MASLPRHPRVTALPIWAERYADRVEFAYVDDAAHFITDDAPAAVGDLAIGWFERGA